MTETKEYLQNAIERLLLDMDPKLALKNFKKSKYETFFGEYCNKEKEIYAKLKELFENSSDLSDDMKEAAMPLIKRAEYIVKSTGRFTRERQLVDLNCVMAFYVLPGILTIGSKEAGDFALVIAGLWKETFPNAQITPGTFEEINSGFRKKLFGVPIQ